MSGEVEGSGGVGYLVAESGALYSCLGVLSLQLFQSHLQLCILRHRGGKFHTQNIFYNQKKIYFYNQKILSPCRKILTKIRKFSS